MTPYTEDHLERANAFMERHFETVQPHEAAALAEEFAAIEAAAPGIGHNQPPAEARLVPERLVDVEGLPALLAANYTALAARQAELEAGLTRWIAQHLVPPPKGWQEGKPWPQRVAIKDDEDNKRTADFLVQLAGFAGGRTPASGEVNEAREKVKRAPYDSCKVIDAYFNGLRETIRTQAAMLDAATTEYLRDKARREQTIRDAEAAAAAEAARLAFEAAQRANATEATIAVALDAEAQAEEAARAAGASVQSMVRTTSAGGTTTTLRSNWTHEVADMMELVKAVAAGKAPVSFLAPNTSMINSAIRSGKPPLRECPGLRIWDDQRAARTGRTS